MAQEGGNVVPRITKAEHIGPADTGDNIEAKRTANYVWDTNSATWVRETQPSGGGGGGASTIADGADVAEGATTDAAVTAGSAGTVSGKLRQISADVSSVKSNTASVATSTKQSDGSQKTQVVDGSGNVVGATSNALDINIKSGNPTTIAATQGTASNLKAQVAQLASISSSATLQNAVGATGNGSTLSVDGMSVVVFTVSGTFTATITFEGTEDGTNYSSLSAVQLGTNTIGSTATAAGVFEAPVAGLTLVRARVTWTSGTSVTVTAHTVAVPYNGKVVNANIVSNSATNQSVNVAQVAGNTTSTAASGTQKVGVVGSAGAAVDGVIGAATSPANMVVGGLVYNSSNLTLTNGQSAAAQGDVNAFTRVTLATKLDSTNDAVSIGGGLMPTGTALNTYSTRITTNATTTPTSSTAYVSSIVVCVETAGTTSTIDIRDKSGTPIYLVRTLSTAAVLNNGDLTINFTTPVKMTSGIDIITAGAAAATVGVFVNYFQ